MHKKLLTLDDLIRFCINEKRMAFSAEESGYRLCVRIPAQFEIDKAEESTTLYCDLKVFHTGRNRNGSSVTEEAAEKCLSTIPYKPLLADIRKIEGTDGEYDFTAHSMEITEDGKVNYIEHQIGCFTTDHLYLDKEADENGRKYVHARVAIPREYTKASEIIERKNGTKVSVELAVNAFEYDANEKIFLFTDIEVLGCTCLGKNPKTGKEISEGMEGSRIEPIYVQNDSFTEDTASYAENAAMKEDIEKLSIEMKEKGKNIKEIKDTPEEINNGKVSEEPKAVFDDEPDTGNTEDTGNTSAPADPGNASQETNSADPEDSGSESSDDPVSEPVVSDPYGDNEPHHIDDGSDAEYLKKRKQEVVYSATLGGAVKTFSKSLNAVIFALSELVNATYGENDNDFYNVEVFDNKTVQFYGMFAGKNYRQSYKEKDGVYSLKNERVELFTRYLTREECDAIDGLKQSYEKVSDELSKYKAEPEKMAILESTDYASIADTEEFTALKAQEAHFNLSTEEVRNAADALLLKAAKSGTASFAKEESKAKPAGSFKMFPVNTAKKGLKNYGNILQGI